MGINSNEGTELLMQAIVEHAVVDYQNAIRNISRYEDVLRQQYDSDVYIKLSSAKDVKAECERFFYSEYCYGLTGRTGDELIEMINRKGKRAKKKNGKN